MPRGRGGGGGRGRGRGGAGGVNRVREDGKESGGVGGGTRPGCSPRVHGKGRYRGGAGARSGGVTGSAGVAGSNGERGSGHQPRGFLSGVKLVVRRLPPSLTFEAFQETMVKAVEEVGEPRFSPIWMRFRGGKAAKASRGHRFSVLYIAFREMKDAVRFTEVFNDHSFVDGKSGVFYTALVERAPNQQIPRSPKGRDPQLGTIEADPDYKAFLTMYEEDESRPTGPLLGTGGLLATTEMVASTSSATRGKDVIVTPLVEELRAKRRERENRKLNPIKPVPSRRERALPGGSPSQDPQTRPAASKQRPPFGPGKVQVLMKKDSDDESPKPEAQEGESTGRPRRQGHEKPGRRKEDNGVRSTVPRERKVRKTKVLVTGSDSSGVNDRLLTRNPGRSVRQGSATPSAPSRGNAVGPANARMPAKSPSARSLSHDAEVFHPSGSSNDPP